VSALPERAPADGGFLSETAEQVDALVGGLPAIDLATLEREAALLRRLDRKYVVSVTTFEHLLQTLHDDWRALDIDGCRLFGYTSTYFDSPDLATYRAHLQRRRRRFKVRVREYAETGEAMLEVKRKGLRGATVKERTPHRPWCDAELDDTAMDFVARSVQGYADLPSGRLGPVVTTRTRRATLVDVGSQARVTVDVDLSCGRGDTATELLSGRVLLETKSEGPGSSVDRTLRRLGARPVEMSKFCVGVAALGLDLPTNPWRRTMRRYFEPTAS
jgi:hypothetical protein